MTARYTLLMVVLGAALLPCPIRAQRDRAYWLDTMDKLARPILLNLSRDDLRQAMPVRLSPHSDNPAARTQNAYLEAFGRLMSGIAPWLGGEGGSQRETTLRIQYRSWALKAISNSVNPGAWDYMAWHAGGQTLVDAAFLSLALIRCPWLWEHLDTVTRRQVVAAFRGTRSIQPPHNNWILFSGMIEAFFCRYNLPWDTARVGYCFRELRKWYVGDGVYGDGPFYHWDYYNSFVIHPFLAAIAQVTGDTAPDLRRRDQRYAEIQERLINADGSFPATGRSIVYRGGAFHHLADMALRKALPPSLLPAQVRSALTAVLHATMDNSFTSDGWLMLGLSGDQPDLADGYITTGSGYLCADILLPLGLPETDPFWSDPPAAWTAKKVWSGQNIPPDHAID